MTLIPSREQRELASSEDMWLAKHDPIDYRRRRLDTAPADIGPAMVRHLRESGVAGLLSPDAGGTHADLAVLTSSHGYAASPAPVADLAIAAWALELAGEPMAEVVAHQHEGARLVLPVVSSPDELRLDTDGQGATLTGRSSVVLGVSTEEQDFSEEFCVITPDDRVAVVGVGQPGLTVETVGTLDLTRRWVRIVADTAPVDSTATLPPGTHARVRDAVAVHRAVDAAAAARRLLDMTVAYAGQRRQFGVEIGTFQAVKHHCASMAVSVEAATATLARAVEALALDDADARLRPISAAIAYAADAASTVASCALQVHGGIGFTWEHDLHLLLRRIKVDENIGLGVRSYRRSLSVV